MPLFGRKKHPKITKVAFIDCFEDGKLDFIKYVVLNLKDCLKKFLHKINL